MLMLQLAAVLALSLVSSLSGVKSKTFDIVDPIADLEWRPAAPLNKMILNEIVTPAVENGLTISTIATNKHKKPSDTAVETILMNQAIDHGQTPFILKDNSINGNHRSQQQQQQFQLQLAASDLLSQLMSLPEGKRRLDDDGTAVMLASNQQWQTNSHRQPQQMVSNDDDGDGDEDDISSSNGQSRQLPQKQQNNHHQQANSRRTDRRQPRQLPMNKRNSMVLSGRSSSDGRRPSLASVEKPLNNNYNYNYNYGNNRGGQRKQAAATSRHGQERRQLQSRMTINNHKNKWNRVGGGSKGKGTVLNKAATVEESDEIAPSDDEIFNDNDDSSSDQRRSGSTSNGGGGGGGGGGRIQNNRNESEDADDDDYDESDDNGSDDGTRTGSSRKRIPIKRTTPRGRNARRNSRIQPTLPSASSSSTSSSAMGSGSGRNRRQPNSNDNNNSDNNDEDWARTRWLTAADKAAEAIRYDQNGQHQAMKSHTDDSPRDSTNMGYNEQDESNQRGKYLVPDAKDHQTQQQRGQMGEAEENMDGTQELPLARMSSAYDDSVYDQQPGRQAALSSINDDRVTPVSSQIRQTGDVDATNMDGGDDQSTVANNNNDGDDEESLSASHLLQRQSSSDLKQNNQQQQQQQQQQLTDLQVAAGHHHGHHHGHYYQYAGVPKKKAWKFGFKRGNHKHTIERHEKGHKNKFHSSFKWHAKEKCKKKKKCESKGKMTWHYEHHKKHHHHH